MPMCLFELLFVTVDLLKRFYLLNVLGVGIKMVTNDMLLKMLIRSYAHMRRDPDRESSEKGLLTLKTRSFGTILDILAVQDGITQADIAVMRDLRQQSVSEALDKMEAHGYIRREKIKGNGRKVPIYITDEGREAQKELKAARTQMADVYFSCLSDQEKDTLFIILSKLSENS